MSVSTRIPALSGVHELASFLPVGERIVNEGSRRLGSFWRRSATTTRPSVGRRMRSFGGSDSGHRVVSPELSLDFGVLVQWRKNTAWIPQFLKRRLRGSHPMVIN